MGENVNEVLIDENESTKHLDWYNISKSKDGCYETQKEVAEAIYSVFKPTLKPHHTIIDPTAGSGRLLIPFKKGIGNVFGVEFKESLARKLKHNIGKNNSRIGDIRDYYNKMISAGTYGVFDIAVCNPPYGLPWEIEHLRYLDTNTASGLAESQLIVVDMLSTLVKTNGSVALIIPTSTWNNNKDRKLVNLIFENFNVSDIVTLQKGFKKEYDLNLLTDIVFMKRKDNDRYNYAQSYPEINKHVISINNIEDLKGIVSHDLNTPYYHDRINIYKGLIKNVPHLDTLSTFESSEYKLSIGTKGITGNENIMSLLDFYDKTNLDHYNPVMGKPTSIKECYFSLPALIKIGVEPVQNLCEKLNINIEFSESNKVKFAKLKEKWDFESTPIYKPKSHELLAYFEHQKYPAKTDLKEKNKSIYISGKEYLIRPTWIRNNHLVEETELVDSKGKKTGEVETKSLESGYLTLEVTSENGIRIYAANEDEKIEEFLKVFQLPDIKGIAEVYPERVKNWANVIAKDHPYLFDWQAEDLARMLCKRTGYIGYEMGGGKTVTGFSYAKARQYSRVLIVCESGLIGTWVNEANKFGFKITVLRKHSDIWRLKQRIKNRDFPRHSTEFFVIGQEFLSLDGGRIYNQWTCTRRNKDGVIIHNELCVKGKCSEGHKYEVMHKTCPSCGAEYSEGWTGRYCNAIKDGTRCGYRPFSYGLTANGRGMNQYPAYKHLRKLFSCVITDESQNFAKRSLRGEATRTFKSKSKIMLTGTIMKNYVEDVFLNFGWLLGYENPIYYYHRGNVKRFLDEFGSYEVISRSYLNEIKSAAYRKRQNGRKKLLPAVSNLNRFWKMISPFTIRRLSEEVAELKVINRHRDYHFLDMDPEHYNVYVTYMEWAKKIIERELRKDDTEINLGVISNCLWKLRFVATCPINPALVLEDVKGEYPNIKLNANTWNKTEKLLEIVTNAKKDGDKVMVFSGMRFMQRFIADFLKAKGFKVKYIGAHIKTKDRFEHIEDFGNNYDVLVTGNNVLNRGYTIIKANHVVFCDYEYTPEVTDQAEFRCIRPGQEKDVKIHYLISTETIDEQMKETCDQKRKAIKNAMDKRNDHAGITEMMKQADYRNPEMKIARDIHTKTIMKKKVLVQKFTERVEEVNESIIDFNEIILPNVEDVVYNKINDKIDTTIKDSFSISENIIEKPIAKKPKKVKEQHQIEFDFGFGD